MVVCKFFQQGYCRYGQNCRFEHIYGSKYNYHSTSNASAPVQSSSIDDQLLKQVESDTQAMLHGGQWILSSYAPFKEKASFPGLSDLSPEEARLFIYEAKANNTMDQAIAYMNNLFKEAKHKYEQLLNPSPALVKVIQSVYKGETVSSPFTNMAQNSAFGSSSSAAASSIFRSAVQNTSAFGQNTQNAPSIFSHQQPSSNVFGSPDQAKSIFAQATQSIFSPNQAQSSVFGSPNNDNAKSIFAQATQNAFGSAQPNQNEAAKLFGSASQNIFGTQQQQSSSPFPNTQSPNVFQSSNAFGVSTNVFEQKPSNEDDSGIYSNMDELSQDDVEAFNSAEFKLGFVPEVPPPRALCI